jgi:hypothetical protein
MHSLIHVDFANATAAHRRSELRVNRPQRRSIPPPKPVRLPRRST